ncbi:TIGR03086 family metal-binding protein [Micromonospora sp. DT48]|uniref:TIGR03086 family metal-binding protein n=1 Tax=unclassified Micromonospora TaxID=2617518 RepID=UPI0012BB9A1F|nr:TIGR03086 family metal-binding protein [Micromonospora sp. CP22]MTK01659.1 TIGR03086 family protein [Micromonospora sp. CP22]
MELLKTYRRSLADFTERVEQVHPGQWSAVTPCPGWDVRALVNHVVSEERWSVPLLAGRTLDEVGDRYDGDQLGADPIAAAREAASQAEVAATSPGALDRTVHTSAGAIPVEEYLRQLLAEHLVHGWDLAVAIGADPSTDADAVAEVARWYSHRMADYRRNGLVEPEVELPAGVSEQDRLLAAFGRDPDWAP